LEFSILANVETKPEVELELDFWNDGTVDFREAIPGIRWRKLDLLVRLPAQPFDSLKVALHKQASGTAVFASLAANGSSKCEGDPIVLSDLPLGYGCSQDANCTSGICEVGTQGAGQTACSVCRTNDDCTGGLMCGTLTSEQPRPSRACVPRQGTPDGDVCWSDEQCVHGHCQNGLCDECVADADCGSDRKCGSLDMPGTRHRACVVPGSMPNNASCSAAEECASGSCCFHVCTDPSLYCFQFSLASTSP
jgi:hypothetical protein